MVRRCTRACNCIIVAKHTEEERRSAAESQVGNNRGEKSERNEKRGRGRTARNIHLEYRRRRTGCGLTRNAYLKKIALPCVKRNPLLFLCLPPLRSNFSLFNASYEMGNIEDIDLERRSLIRFLRIYF